MSDASLFISMLEKAKIVYDVYNDGDGISILLTGADGDATCEINFGTDRELVSMIPRCNFYSD